MTQGVITGRVKEVIDGYLEDMDADEMGVLLEVLKGEKLRREISGRLEEMEIEELREVLEFLERQKEEQ